MRLPPTFFLLLLLALTLRGLPLVPAHLGSQHAPEQAHHACAQEAGETHASQLSGEPVCQLSCDLAAAPGLPTFHPWHLASVPPALNPVVPQFALGIRLPPATPPPIA